LWEENTPNLFDYELILGLSNHFEEGNKKVTNSQREHQTQDKIDLLVWVVSFFPSTIQKK
jgi:hypothetical protein